MSLPDPTPRAGTVFTSLRRARISMAPLTQDGEVVPVSDEDRAALLAEQVLPRLRTAADQALYLFGDAPFDGAAEMAAIQTLALAVPALEAGACGRSKTAARTCQTADDVLAHAEKVLRSAFQRWTEEAA